MRMKFKNINYSVLKSKEFGVDIMRGKPTPEDKIIGVVLARLKKQIGFTFLELEVETGIPSTTLSGVFGLTSTLGNSGRIKLLADYFNRVHKLDYITSDYLLTGNDEDRERVQLLREQDRLDREVQETPFEAITKTA